MCERSKGKGKETVKHSGWNNFTDMNGSAANVAIKNINQRDSDKQKMTCYYTIYSPRVQTDFAGVCDRNNIFFKNEFKNCKT